MKIVIYSLNDVVTKFIYWKKIVIDTLNDTQKKIPQNHTQILYYKNFPSKMWGKLLLRMPEKISGDFKTSANFLRKYENSG